MSIFGRMQNTQAHVDTFVVVTAYFKVVCAFFQISGSFLYNLEVEWPDSITNLFVGFALFNLDFFALPTTECMLSDLNHYSKLVICTIVPLVVLALLALPAAAITVTSRENDTEDKKKTKEKVIAGCSFAILSFLFVVYPFVSHMVLGTFSCVPLLPGSNGAWLKTDLRELCPKNSNSPSYAWSIFFTFVYVIGVPALFLSMLIFFNVPKLARGKMKMHKLKAVLKEIGIWQSDQFTNWDGTSEPVNFLSSFQCKEVLEHKFQSRAQFEHGGASDVINEMANSGLEEGPGLDEETVEVDAELPVDELRAAVAKRVDTLCSEQLVVLPPVTWNGETGPEEVFAMENAGFVFTMYEVDCWWFEIFELIRKLSLSALIIFIGNPDIRLAVAFLISFLSLLVVFFTRPFVSPSLDTLMIFSLITQTLTLSYLQCSCWKMFPRRVLGGKLFSSCGR
mmetsp:Transcript_34384/g.50329  ORF Transcript_34384/g.50329 Transcript_34384/m.50329 type:complete len:451 (+) Transcript_34384:131-1483(+)